MGGATIRVTYEPTHGLGYISLVPISAGEAVKQRLVYGEQDIILDFNGAGQLIGIELLRGGLLHPTLIAAAVPPGQGA